MVRGALGTIYLGNNVTCSGGSGPRDTPEAQPARAMCSASAAVTLQPFISILATQHSQNSRVELKDTGK